MIIYACDHGIVPDSDISEQLSELFAFVKDIDGEKTVVFQAGTYRIDSQKCARYRLVITNTVGDSEFSADETPHLASVAFYLNGISDLTVDGNGAFFVIDGKATNMAIEYCRNLTIKNIEIRHRRPDMHELTVLKKTPFSVDFAVDRDTDCLFERGKLLFRGNGYSVDARRDPDATYIGLIHADTPDKVERTRHPLFAAGRLKPLGERRFRAFYPNTMRFHVGDRFYLYDVRRQHVGIFIEESKNIVLEGIKQRFNYSLALVAQCTEDLTVRGATFAPEENAARRLASGADFLQFCMCRGQISVKDCLFDGAGDDCLNVHGVHFKIVEKHENQLTVRFMHPQTHGFDPFRIGDRIAFIDPATLLETGTATLLSSRMSDEYHIVLTLDRTDGAANGYAVEDVSACPSLDFTDNTATRIITRGLLLTTRGKVRIERNHFISTTMSGILLSDDASNWYESGLCEDVVIRDNRFDFCGETPILIKPENSRHAGAVHKNISIIDNTFCRYNGDCIRAASTDLLLIRGNRFLSRGRVQTENCTHVTIED